MAEIKLNYINNMANAPDEFIKLCEDKYHCLVGEIAEKIVSDENIRLILLAGPSGSGKTTTANLLCDAVKMRGKGCIVLSLDDFYRDSTDILYPKLPNGERDFEAPEALNLPDLKETISDIAENREFKIPKFDFKLARRVSVQTHTKPGHGCVIIEGLHALNPKIFSHLDKSRMLKIFISVSTNINDENGSRLISGRKLRFIRRMVRDNFYRNSDAERTLSLWQNVLKGEDLYLYPNRSNADIDFNTFHEFEPCIMKPFAMKLLPDELMQKSEFLNTVKVFLDKVESIDEKYLPQNSLIREFIIGGMYEHLY